MTKYGVNSTPKWVCKTHNEAYNHDEGCKWCEVKPWVPPTFAEWMANGETCPSLGTFACGCLQCINYQQGLYP